MKTRTRKLTNGKWIAEARRWWHVRWQGIYIDLSLTTGAALGKNGGRFVPMPMPRYVAPGDINYSLCMCDSQPDAEAVVRDYCALFGGSPHATAPAAPQEKQT